MSYILDALRRADSERERGGIPGLHAQSMHADPHDMRARAWWGQPWAWVTAGLCGGLLVAAGAVWLFSGTSPTAAPALPPLAMAPMPAPTIEAQTAPVPVAVPVPVPVPAGPVTSPVSSEPVKHAPPLLATAPPAGPTYNAPPLEPRKPAAAASAPAEAGQGGNRIHALAELPDDVRRQIPNLSIGGSSYSENPGSRLLILNGQVYRQGDKVAADLVLEQIQLKSAVFRFQSYRYSVSY